VRIKPRFYGEALSRIVFAFPAARLIANLGCALILARSFARIHETNLKVRTMTHRRRSRLNQINKSVETRRLASVVRRQNRLRTHWVAAHVGNDRPCGRVAWRPRSCHQDQSFWRCTPFRDRDQAYDVKRPARVASRWVCSELHPLAAGQNGIYSRIIKTKGLLYLFIDRSGIAHSTQSQKCA
jgi:hypothetical protein